MKIRIKGNFIRYRLTQSEVRTLAETGHLEEQTRFAGGSAFRYALRTRTGLNGLDASFADGTITLWMPAEAAATWPDSEQVGFKNSVEVAPGEHLGLLLEKDFVCLDTVEEDQSDNYPNPRKNEDSSI